MSDERTREEGGTYDAVVSDDDLLAVFTESDKPVLTVPMVADNVPIGRKAVHTRLQNLHSKGKLKRMEVGARAVVWWPAKGP